MPNQQDPFAAMLNAMMSGMMGQGLGGFMSGDDEGEEDGEEEDDDENGGGNGGGGMDITRMMNQMMFAPESTQRRRRTYRWTAVMRTMRRSWSFNVCRTFMPARQLVLSTVFLWCASGCKFVRTSLVVLEWNLQFPFHHMKLVGLWVVPPMMLIRE